MRIFSRGWKGMLFGLVLMVCWVVGLFSGDITIPQGVKEISVGVSNSQRGSYTIVARYTVK